MLDLYALKLAFSCMPRFQAGATGQTAETLAAHLTSLFYDALPWPVFEALWLSEGAAAGNVACVAEIFLKGV